MFWVDYMNKKQLTFKNGIVDGIPIGLGYLAVSFGFGIMAVNIGLSILQALSISVTNVTSAGQVAGLTIISAGGTLLEMALTQLIINLRYSLMGISLTQKLDGSFNTFHRLITSFCITDEVFAVASTKGKKITPKYMYGLILIPFIGWSIGTFLGGAAGNILPQTVCNALGIAIYGMFVAIIIPPACENRGVLICVITAVALSCIIYYVPVFHFISSGFSIIICAVFASALCAYMRPVEEAEDE